MDARLSQVSHLKFKGVLVPIAGLEKEQGDRARHTIREVVKLLETILEDS